MKKRSFILALVLILAFSMGALSGCTEGWTPPPEEEANGDITLSGSKWSGKVVTTLVLHPDGTVDTDLNGEKGTGTWEAGSGDVAMVAHITVKGEPVDIEITDEGESYSAVFTPVPDFVITGKKDGSTAAPEPTEEPATGEPTPTPGPMEYPENSLVLDFTPDISEQLQKMFYVESGTWGPALGASGSYTPTESEDELFTWITTGSSVHLTFFANGTYKYEFTTMNIEEIGTWSFEGYKVTITTPKGATYESTISK